MSNKKDLSYLIGKHKKAFIIISICLFLIELEIFAVAVMKSGKQTYIQILNTQDEVIYESDGKNLTDFNKYYFEKNFGSLDQYKRKLQSKEVPFPFRAWFSAAIGVPIGLVLLISFILKAYLAFFGDEIDHQSNTKANSQSDTKFEKVLNQFNQVSVFTWGGVVFVAIFGYWVIPETFKYIGKIGIETMFRFKWFFLVTAIMGSVFFVWVVYLRYLLATKTIESKAEIEKHRLQLAYEHGDSAILQLEHKTEKTEHKTKPHDDNIVEGRIVT